MLPGGSRGAEAGRWRALPWTSCDGCASAAGSTARSATSPAATGRRPSSPARPSHAPASCCPTGRPRGSTSGPRPSIHAIVRDLAAFQRIAVVVVSDEEDEVLGLADAVVIFRAGRCDGTVYPRGMIDVRRLRQLAWTGTETDAGEGQGGA